MSAAQEIARLPIGAIRCFEAFGRLGDIGEAARELGITSSAVSHQLRGLEEMLGARLTERRGRRLWLSSEGRGYFEAVSPAFLVLKHATSQLRRHQLPRRVTISALPLVANGWLLSRLGAFMAQHPGIEIRLQYARYRNYSSDAADLSLRFGTGDWPGYASEKLLGGLAFPVASPRLVERLGPFAREADLLRAPLIHDGSTEQWAGWLEGAGVVSVPPLRGMVCEDGLLTRTAMLADIGVALTRPLLIEEELRSGRLVQLFERGIGDGQDYYLCLRNTQDLPSAVRQVAAWLRVLA